MRLILVLALLFLAILAVVLPIIYIYTASQIPSIESEFDLDRHLKAEVEGDRMAARQVHYDKDKPVTWRKPDITKYPKDVVNVFLSGWGCPTFFQTPRETGGTWVWRVIAGYLFNRAPPGDGRCEWIFANDLAVALHVGGGLKQAIAANKIHDFLQRDQLVAYDLSSLTFVSGVIGIEDATQAVTHRPVESLKLEELAELSLILPPGRFYYDIRDCRNVTLIREGRDGTLDRLANQQLITVERMMAARAQPLACARRWLSQ